MKDKLWFWGSVRAQAAEQTLAGIYYNLTPTGHAYTPDLTRPADSLERNQNESLRLTWQVVAEEQDQPAAPERQPAAAVLRLLARPADERARGDLLLEVGADVSVAGRAGTRRSPASCCSKPACSTTTRTTRRSRSRTTRPTRSPYSDSGTGFSWGNYGNTYGHNASHNFNTRFAASYVTGSHAFKTGVTFMHLWAWTSSDVVNNGMTLQLLNGVPRQVTVFATPFSFYEILNQNWGAVRAGSVDAQAR